MGPLRKPDFLLFYWLHVATEEKKNPSHTRIDLSLGKVRVHQSLALSILNKHAAHRDNHLCIFFFLSGILENTFDSLTLTENHKKQVTHVAIKECCNHLFAIFTRIKKLEMTPAYLREKTGLIRRQLFAMCFQEMWTCLSMGAGPYGAVALVLVISKTSRFLVLQWILMLVMQGEHWFGLTRSLPYNQPSNPPRC